MKFMPIFSVGAIRDGAELDCDEGEKSDREESKNEAFIGEVENGAILGAWGSEAGGRR